MGVDVVWSQQGGWTNKENQLVVDKLLNYPPRKHVRPVDHPNEQIHLEMNFTVARLIEFDQENMMVTIQGMRSEMWHDKFLTWDPADYDGVASDGIWRPDIRDYNAIKEQTGQDEVVMMAFADGTVANYPPTMHKIGCHWQIWSDDICHLGDVHCKLILGTWTYTRDEVEMTTGMPQLEPEDLHDPKDVDWHLLDMDFFKCHPRWNLYNPRAKIENKVYDFPGEYPMMNIHFCMNDARTMPGVGRTGHCEEDYETRKK